MREVLTDLLDVLGLLLLAAGLAAGAYLLIGWACLAVAGAVVLAGSQLAHRIAQPTARERERQRERLRSVA